MTSNEKEITSSGVLGAPEGGASLNIVPVQCASSSNHGQDVDNTSGVEDAGSGAECAGKTPLRLEGGALFHSDEEEDDGEDKADPDFAVPGPSTRTRPKERSRSTARRGTRRRNAEREEGSGDPRDEKESGKETDGSTDREKESGSSLPAAAEDIHTPNIGPKEGVLIPLVVAGESRVPSREASPMSTASTGSKRTREEVEDAEVVVSDENGMGHLPPAKRVIKRRKDGRIEERGRPAKDPSHAGEFTGPKILARKLAKEEKQLAEVEDSINDPAVKADTPRSAAVERNVLRLLDDLRESPTEAITQLGIIAVERVKKVAAFSKNLSGSFVGSLWIAAEELTALNLALTMRAQAVGSEEEGKKASELEGLRRELSALRTSEALLQAQVRALREAVAQGEAARAVVPPTADGTEVSSGRKRRGGPKTYVPPSTTSSEDTMDMERVERDLSPVAKEAGRIAREEVDRDRREGTLPLAVRPSLQGRPTTLGVSGFPSARGAEVPPTPPRTFIAPSYASVPGIPSPGGAGMANMESMVRMMMKAMSAEGLVFTPGTTPAVTPTAGPLRVTEGRTMEGKRKGDPPLPTLREAHQDEGEGTKKKRKRKNKKKKKVQARSDKEGPLAPPSPTAPPPSGRRGPAPVVRSAPAERPVQPGPAPETWATVVSRKERRRALGAQTGGGQPPPRSAPPPPIAGRREGVPLPRGPRGAAVTLTCPEGRYAQVLTEARGAIDLKELGISGIRTRRAVTGALVLEIPGQEGAAKAEGLRRKMADLFAGREDIKVSRPVKRLELRVRDLDHSVTTEDVIAAVTGVGGCKDEEVQVGPIRKGPNNLGTVWLRCPIMAARKVVAGGRLTIGWNAARVEVLTMRPLQCFKCLREGHVRANCPSGVDRSGLCYRCGATDHKAGSCTAEMRCPVCADAQLPSNHRLGGRACKGTKPGGKKGGGGAQTPQPAPRGGMGMGTLGNAEEAVDPPPKGQRVRRPVKPQGEVTPMEVSPEETGDLN